MISSGEGCKDLRFLGRPTRCATKFGVERIEVKSVKCEVLDKGAMNTCYNAHERRTSEAFIGVESEGSTHGPTSYCVVDGA